MFSSICNAFGLGMLLAVLTALPVSAKGGFAFITISGTDSKEEIRSTDPGLTSDYFAFADFYLNRVGTPTDPGVGYRITRYYLNGTHENAFDQLHYYPETGFVFYDGIVNGESEYDGKWYSANPAMKNLFEKTFLAVPAAGSAPGQGSGQVQPQTSLRDSLIQFVMPVAILAGLAILLLLIARQRKVFVR